MSGFTPWRGTRGPAPAAPAEPISDTAKLLAELTKARNENASLRQELAGAKRERNRYQRERDSARLMLAAAKRECEAGCMHAKANIELVHTLHAQERVIAGLQAVNEGYESPGFVPRRPTFTEAFADPALITDGKARVPRQRRRSP